MRYGFNNRHIDPCENMKEFIVSLAFCVFAGMLALAICPKTKLGRSVAFLVSAVVTGAVISLFSSYFLNGKISLTLPEIVSEDYSEKTNAAMCSAVEKTVAENLFAEVYDYLGVYPESVKAKVEYKNGEFYLISADVVVNTELADGLREHIRKKTGMEVTICAAREKRE